MVTKTYGASARPTASRPMPNRRRPSVTGPPNRSDTRRPGLDLRYWFARLLLETLTGQRPVAKMIKLAAPPVYERLWHLAEEGRLRHRPGAASPKVIGCRHSQPCPGVLEVSAHIRAAGRSRAMAFRLERGGDQQWRCTALETG